MQVEGQHGLSLLRLMATGARVSNAYATFPRPRDSRPKGRVTPGVPFEGHPLGGIREGRGWACVRLASRRGNGPPGRRSVGVLRGRSPTLELRHGPNSYGRQQ